MIRNWQSFDKKTLKRVNQIVRDIQRSPHSGICKPEPLKGDLSGWWARRIDGANRIVCRLKGGTVEITQCKSDYGG